MVSDLGDPGAAPVSGTVTSVSGTISGTIMPVSGTAAPAPISAAHARPSLAEEIRQRTGHNPARCYQCGKCSAGCPMAEETALRPHDVLRLVTQDRREALLSSESLWLCLGCETCTARCPNDCDPAAVIDTLRAMAVEQAPGNLPKALFAFHRSFLDQIFAQGRLAELGLMVRYKLRSGALFQDAAAAPGMISRGKLRLSAPKVKGVEEVRAIFRACEAENKEARR